MELIAKINGAINGVVWGVPMLALLMGAGILLTVALKGIQFRKFGYAMKNTIGKMFQKTEAKAGEVTPFQALTTALAATVGTGNISGITLAVTLGGAGSIFWLWISALLGMATKFSEVTLAVRYREKNEKGDWVGGPMYYITNGLGQNWKWLAVIFALFGGLASFGIGNATQVQSIITSCNTAIQAFVPAAADHVQTINIVLAVIVMIIVGIVLIGGIKRIGNVTEKLVPFMAVVYILSCLTVIAFNITKVPAVIGMIFEGAFNPKAVTGGVVGTAIMSLTWGVKRGVFSNEAGMGSAPIAHAATSETDPVKQGLYGIFEVFMDTIVICTLSGLTLLLALTPEQLNYGVEGTTALNAAALGTVFGPKIGSLIIAIGLSLFALSTVLSWGLYGCRCWEYLLGRKAIRPYQVIFTALVIVSSLISLKLAWDIADTLNGLMAIPNLIALLFLFPTVVKLTKEHFDKQKTLKK